jgi:DNA-binding MarR family transcriptional regulator
VDGQAETALVAMRRILRATDINVRKLARESGLTTSQMIVLQRLARSGPASAGDIARAASLSQATVTSLLDKLGANGLVVRERGSTDRRRVWVEITDAGRAKLAGAPDLLQERFLKRFKTLEDWEQAFLNAALLRVVDLLGAEDIDASPLLDTGELDELPGR